MKYLIIVKIALDFILVYFSFFLAKIIRESNIFNLPFQTLNNSDLVNYSFIGATIIVIVFGIHGLYNSETRYNKLYSFSRLILYTFYSFAFFSISIYLTQDFLFDTQIPRLIIILSFLLSLILIILNRLILNIVESKFGKKIKILIFSNSSSNDFYELIKTFKNSKKYEIIGVGNNYKLGLIGIKEFTFEQIKEIIKNKETDEIFYINSDLGKEDLEYLWNLTKIFGIKYKYIANSFDLAKVNTKMILMNGIPVLKIQNYSISGGNYILKRFIDLLLSVIAIIIFSPLLIIVALLIKLEDPKGPIIFKNRRVGKDGKEFDLYKFRYMKWIFCIKESYKVSEENKKLALEYEKELIKKSSTRSGPLYKIKNDPRKTRIGTFIEKYSIDELPQFFNVILGNMSIVGPRPHQPREVEKYEIEHKRLLTIKPGITGMAQVNGRETNSFSDEANLDLYYIDNWSILLEMKILFKTVYVILMRK